MNLQLFYRANYDNIVDQLTLSELQSILIERGVKIGTKRHDLENALIHSLPMFSPSVQFNLKWKTSFFSSFVDSKRIQITSKELCENDWIFRIKKNQNDSVTHRVKFHLDYTFETSFHENRYLWRFFRQEYVQVCFI